MPAGGFVVDCAFSDIGILSGRNWCPSTADRRNGPEHCSAQIVAAYSFFMMTRTQPEPALPENSVGRPFPVLFWQYFQVSPSNS